MTTLTGSDLFEYLNHLEQEVTKRQAQHNENTFSNTIHGFMGDLIQAEQRYLTHINPDKDKAMLSFAGSGLPSIESFGADLDSMLKEESLELLDSKYKRCSENEYDLNNFHQNVSEKEFQKVFETYDPKKLRKEYQFEITETKGGEFNLFFREESYLDSINSFSQENPMFVRFGNVSYDIKWDKLFVKNDDSFYIPVEELKEVSNLPVLVKQTTGLFDEIKYGYRIYSNHLKKIEVPGKWFGKRKKIPNDYHGLILASYNAELNITNRIIDEISKQFQGEISIKKIEDENKTIEVSIEDIIPIVSPNSNEVIPSEEYKEKLLYQINIEQQNGEKSIGTIEYWLPHYYYTSHYKEYCYGSVRLNIKKEAITDGDLNFNLLLNLKPKKIMKRLLK